MSFCALKLYFILGCILSCNTHEYNSKKGWEAASNYLTEYLDFTVNPCDDFYKFLCGNVDKNFQTTNLELIRPKELTEGIGPTLTSAINKIDLKNPKTENFKKSLKVFHTQCLSRPNDPETLVEDAYNNLNKYLLPVIEEGANGTDRYPWNAEGDDQFWKFVGTMQRETAITFLFSAKVAMGETTDCKASVPILYLRPVFPEDNDWSLMNNFKYILNNVVSKYHNVTLSEKDINDTEKATIAFKTDLRALLKLKSGNDELNYFKVKFSELESLIPDVAWSSYFEGLLPADIRIPWEDTDPTIVLENKSFFQQIASVVKKHDRVASTNFGFLFVLQKYYEFFQYAKFKVINENDRYRDLKIFSDQCMNLVVKYFSAATVRLLSDEYNVDLREWRNDITLIKESMFSAFRLLVYGIDWMNSDDKVRMTEITNKMNFYGDLPSWILSDKDVNAKTPQYNFSLSLIANDIAAQKDLFKQQMKPLATGRMDDMPPNLFSNAYFDPGQAGITYLVGWQVSPFYLYSYPLAVKFGTFAWLLGHEFMHRYDEVNVKDPILNLQNSTLDTFKNKSECLIKQFNRAYCPKAMNGNCYMGRQLIREVFADTEGMQIAYTTHKIMQQLIGNETSLYNLTNFTSDQIFFMASARRYCSNIGISDDGPRTFSKHGTPQTRVEQSTMNFSPFAKAFNCPSGSRYAIKESCSIFASQAP